VNAAVARQKLDGMKNRNRLRWQQILIGLGISLAIAILLNWAILKLFGQKSAERAEHSLVGIVLLMAYVSRFVDTQETRLGAVAFFLLALIPCYLGTVFPDLDITVLGIGAHRNPLFHSSLSFFVLLWLVRRQSVIVQGLVFGYGIGLASHLLWDALFYGDVRWLPGGVVDRLWLAGNGLACLVPLMVRSQR
jgi:membrane-bound metal-dependent hydrolase YbcI (DUF457 family)